MGNASGIGRGIPNGRGRHQRCSVFRATTLAAGMGLGCAAALETPAPDPVGALAWNTSAPSPNQELKLPLKLMALKYRNPDLHNQPDIDSLDDLIRLVQANLETDRFMRDSLGIAAANIEILCATDADLDSARMRVYGMLQSLDLRFRADETQRMRMGQAKGYVFNPGYIPIASAYFALRDSLQSLRSRSVKVKFEETPYRAPYSYNADSTLAFLKRLRDLTLKEDTSFRARLIDQARGGIGYLHPRGVQCDIMLGRLLTTAEIKDQSTGDSRSVPVWLNRFRDKPLLQRLQSLENLVLVAIGLSAAAILAGLFLGIAFVISWMRRRRRT